MPDGLFGRGRGFWGWGSGYGGWSGRPWPGRGPFSHLPLWERPGWLYGRGACWRLSGPWRYGYPPTPYEYGTPMPAGYPWTAPVAPPAPPMVKEQEISWLESEAIALEQELVEIKKRLEELRK